MRTLFVAAVAVLVVIGIDGWLCLGTLTPGALAAKIKPAQPGQLRTGNHHSAK